MKAFRRRAMAALLAATVGSCATLQAAIAPTPGSVAATSAQPTAASAAPAAALSIAFDVALDPSISDAQSGRLILVATPAAAVRIAQGGRAPIYLADGVYAGQETSIAPGEEKRADLDTLAFPAPISKLPPGDYWVQARLDRNHNAAYQMVDAEHDLTSLPVKVKLPSAAPIQLTLQPERATIAAALSSDRPLTPDAQRSREATIAADVMRMAELNGHIRDIDFVSPSLSAFWGRPIHIRGEVLLPPDYGQRKETYPTVYRAEGFGAVITRTYSPISMHYNMMKAGETPPMIRVFLDHSSPWGTTEFADSVNTGPWGKALTEELIPWLEKQYRMDAKPSGRFTTGHSSGGWFAIWQQVAYPKVYGGTWARAPDPVDFRSFTGVDIYAANANAYRQPDGSMQTLVRDANGKETTSLKDYAQRERVLGDYGGQFDSFNWVFSPKGDDGRPMPLFDRVTGAVDSQVAQYWREHYDISAAIRRDWKTLKPDLEGKIHVIIGENDTFHLNEAAQLLKQEMDKLGAKARFTFIPGGTHFNLDLLTKGASPGFPTMGLEKQIAWEMWAVARPNSPLKPKAYPAQLVAPAAAAH